MNIVDRYGASLAAVLGAAVGAYSILEAPGNDGLIAESLDVWFGSFVSPQWAGTVAVVAAVLTLIALQIRRSSALVAASAVVGCIVIAVPSFVPVGGNIAVSTNSVGAGLLLGAVGAIAAGHRLSQLAFALGILAAVLFKGAVDVHLPADEGRWTVSFPEPFEVNSTIPIVVLAVVAASIAAVALRAASGIDQLDVPSTVVLLALPFGFLLAYVYLGSFTSTTTTWVVAAIVSLVLVLAASRIVDARDGNVLLAGFAVAAASVNGLGWGPTSWWVAVLGVLALLGGAVMGLFRPSVKVATGLLVAVTASGLLAGTAWLGAVPTIAYAVVFPFAVGMAMSSCLPAGVAASVVGPMLPLCTTLFSDTAPAPPPDYGWTSGLAENYVPPTVVLYSPLFVGVVIAALSVVAVGAARRRL